VPAQAAATPATGEFEITEQQRRGLTVEPVALARFQPVRLAEGKIAVNEDKTTAVFSQYSSARVIKTFANSGDIVEPGAPLVRIETPDMVQGATDLTTAIANLSKAKSQVKLAEIVEARQHELVDAKASALKDWQQAQADLNAARNDLRSADIAVAAVRNRLMILGKSAKDIAGLEAARRSTRFRPSSRRSAASSCNARSVRPVHSRGFHRSDFVLGDLSTVWMVASVKEIDVPFVKIGQPIAVRVLAYPERIFAATIVNVGSTIDPTTRRLQVRAEVENPNNMLKPEMFAAFQIATGAAVERAGRADQRDRL